jgi:hypothetical protein
MEGGAITEEFVDGDFVSPEDIHRIKRIDHG